MLLVEESHALPLVSIVVALRSSSAFGPVGKEGLARITGRMLPRRRVRWMKAHAIEDAIDRLGGGELSSIGCIDFVAAGPCASDRPQRGAVRGLVGRLLGTPDFPARGRAWGA